MSNRLHSAGSRCNCLEEEECAYTSNPGDVHVYQKQTSTEKYPSELKCCLFLCCKVLQWLKIQNAEKQGALMTLGCAQVILFPSHEPEKDHLCSWPEDWSPEADLPQGCHSHPGAPTLHGKSCCQDNTCTPCCHTVAGTLGSTLCPPCMGHNSAFYLPALPTMSLCLPTASLLKTGMTYRPPYKPK